MINKKRLIRLTQQLIRIDSQNPPGEESRIAIFVRDYFRGLAPKTEILTFKKKRCNVIATFAGRSRKNSLLVTPHLDTVPAGRSWRFPPFSGRLLKGRIYGLGATDCKGNLAAGMEAIRSIIEERVTLDYNLIFAATCDEESGSSLGLIPLLEKGILRPRAAVVLDSDDFEIIVAQKGLLHLKVKICGKKAHGAYPWLGINAIDAAMEILRELKSLRLPYQKNNYLRPPTLNIGTIRGGDKVNVVADWCEFELDFRFLPGGSEAGFLSQLRRVIKKYPVKFTLEIEGTQKPYQIKKAHPLVEYLKKAARVVGAKPQVKGSEGATTITFFQDYGIPAVATGFGSRGLAHTANEYARIDNLYKGAQLLEEFFRSFRFDKE